MGLKKRVAVMTDFPFLLLWRSASAPGKRVAGLTDFPFLLLWRRASEFSLGLEKRVAGLTDFSLLFWAGRAGGCVRTYQLGTGSNW